MLKKIKPTEITDNAIDLIGNQTFLLASGTSDNYNMMTAAWGGLGLLWSKPVAYTFVRHSRHTYEFTEKNDYFSMNFFEDTKENKKILNICGSESGRDINKMNIENLTVSTENDCVYFNEAKLVLICKKQYFSDIVKENFTDDTPLANYKNNDWHRMYVGRIVKALKQ